MLIQRFRDCGLLITRLRTLLLLAVVVIAAVAFPRLLSGFQDGVEAKLAEARETHKAGVAAAKAEVIEAFRAEAARLTEMKKIEAATRVTDELKYFEKDGLLLGRLEMKKAFIEYGETRKKLGDALTETYTKTATELTQEGKGEQGDKVLRELQALGLPGPLNSIKLFGTSGYVAHGEYKGVVHPAPNFGTQLNATFELVNGLAESGYLSIRSLNIPNHYLVHGDFRIKLQPFEDTTTFRQNATFKRVKGVAKPTGVSFEAINFPRHYVRAYKGELFLERETSGIKRPTLKDKTFFVDATFAIVEPLVKLW